MDKESFSDLAETYHLLNDQMDTSRLDFTEIDRLLSQNRFIEILNQKMDYTQAESYARLGVYFQLVV